MPEPDEIAAAMAFPAGSHLTARGPIRRALATGMC
jgi:hypothetical protein